MIRMGTLVKVMFYFSWQYLNILYNNTVKIETHNFYRIETVDSILRRNPPRWEPIDWAFTKKTPWKNSKIGRLGAAKNTGLLSVVRKLFFRDNIMNVSYEQSEHLIKGKPLGYIIHPGPIETTEPFWGIYSDKIKRFCSFVLIKYLGSPIWIRQSNYLIKFFPNNS